MTMRGAARYLLGCLLALTAPLLQAQAVRLLGSSAVTERDDHLDLAIEFTCSLRYSATHPASEGDRLRVTLQIGPDCGLPGSAQFPVDRLLPVDARGLVRSIELQPGLAGGAELVISWNRIETFVLAPSAGMRGPAHPRAAQALDADPRRRRAGSRPDLFREPRVVARDLHANRRRQGRGAAQRAGLSVRRHVQDETWYRLRAGPFDSRREAERVLRDAQRSYPTAWLGIDDEQAGDADCRRRHRGTAAHARRLAAPGNPRRSATRRALASARTRHVAAQTRRCHRAADADPREPRTTCTGSMPPNCWASRASARASLRRRRRPTRTTCGATRIPRPHRASGSGCRRCARRACRGGAAAAATARSAAGRWPAMPRRSTGATTRSCRATNCRATSSRRTP